MLCLQTGQNPRLIVSVITSYSIHYTKLYEVAILGMVGSGKSTLLKLLAGLYKPQQGNIFIGNMDIQQLSRDRLNEMIGYAPQNVKLISGTLRENLLLGLAGISDETILSAASETGLIQLINALPQGLDTPVPEGGESVSGGQKQMIFMTRLVLMKPQARNNFV